MFLRFSMSASRFMADVILQVSAVQNRESLPFLGRPSPSEARLRAAVEAG